MLSHEAFDEPQPLHLQVGLPPGQLDPAPVVAELMSLMDEIATTRYRESTGEELGLVTNTAAGGGGL